MPPARVPVVVFMTSFDPGGSERQMIELARRLDRNRFEVHVACFHRRGAWRQRAEELAASVTEYPIRGFSHPSALIQAARFARWCRRTRVGVVQACDLYTNIFALPAAAAAGVPVRVASRRGLNPDRSRAHRAAQGASYRFAHRVVANSLTVASEMRRQGFPADRIVVIPNGLDVTAFRPIARCGGIRRVGTLARLHPVKGLDVLVDAAARLRADVPGLEVIVAGEGPERAALERRIAALGLSGRVHLPGHREDVAAALAGLDLFVLPSRSEAFPNALVEAMASSLPVVASAVGGVPEVVEDGHTGILVPPGDPDRLAEAIRQMVARPDLARTLAKRGRARVLQRYSFDRTVAGFEALYLEIAAGGQAATTPESAPEAAGAR